MRVTTAPPLVILFGFRVILRSTPTVWDRPGRHVCSPHARRVVGALTGVYGVYPRIQVLAMRIDERYERTLDRTVLSSRLRRIVLIVIVGLVVSGPVVATGAVFTGEGGWPATAFAQQAGTVSIDTDGSTPPADTALSPGERVDFQLQIQYRLQEGQAGQIEIYFPDAGGHAATVEVTGDGELQTLTRSFEKAVPEGVPVEDGFGVSVVLRSGEGAFIDGDDMSYSVATMGNPPRIESATPSGGVAEVSVGESREFSVEASDQDGDDLTYAWHVDFRGDSSGFEQMSSNSRSSFSYTFDQAGDYVVKVEVSDGSNVASETWTVGVENADGTAGEASNGQCSMPAREYWECVTEENWGYEGTELRAYHEMFPEDRGEGRNITIIDTGFDTSHPLYNPIWDGEEYKPYHVNVVDTHCIGPDCDGDTDIHDSDGHGTMVSGGVWQAAPNANYSIIRISKEDLDRIDCRFGDPEGTVEDRLVEALDYADNSNSDVIVSAQGNHGYQRNDGTSAVSNKANEVADSNTSIVWAAGNSEGKDQGILGALFDCDRLTSDQYPIRPASAAEVIAVSSTIALESTPHTQSVSNPNSPENSYNDKPDLAAPGFDVFTLGKEARDGYRYASGSSFAAPHVAGIALLLSRHGTANEVKQALENSGRDIPDAELDGEGSVSILGAYGELAGTDGHPEPAVQIRDVEHLDDTVRFRIELRNAGESAETTSNGVHLNLDSARFMAVELGDFDQCNTLTEIGGSECVPRSSSGAEGEVLELYVDGDEAVSGFIEVSLADPSTATLRYRGWIRDDADTTYNPYEKQYERYIARYPAESPDPFADDGGRQKHPDAVDVYDNEVNPPYAKAASVAYFSITDYRTQSTSLDSERTDDGDNGSETVRHDTDIADCRIIEEAGAYTLTDDIQNGQVDSCIHIRSDDVVLDGNGHAISGAGQEDTTGIWAFNGTLDEHSGDELQNVTIRNLRTSDWGTGIQAGELFPEAGPENIRIENVETGDNGQGIVIRSASATLVDVTSRDNDMAGISTLEVNGVTMRNITTTGNGNNGIGLHQETHDVVVENAISSGNGGAGVHIGSDGVRGNVIQNSSIAANGGAGVVMSSDVHNNTLRGSVVEGNAGAGVVIRLSASETTVTDTRIVNNDGAGMTVSESSGHADNVTFVDNGALAYRGLERSEEFSAERLHVGPSASASFDSGTVDIGPVSDVSADDSSVAVVGDGLEVDDVTVASNLTVELAYDANAIAGAGADESGVTLQRFDGSQWVEVSESTVDTEADLVSGIVQRNGTIAPVVASSDSPTTTPEPSEPPVTPSDTPSPSTPTPDEPVAEEPETSEPSTEPEASTSVFKVLATASGEFDYRFTVDGSVEKIIAEDGTAADADDRVVENEDGTMTVIGSTGDNAGDAYAFSGEITSFERTGGSSGFELRRDGEDVTAELTADGEADGVETTTAAGDDVTESVFKVMSTTDGAEFTYRFTVDGRVTKTMADDGTAADDEEEIVDTGDGTVTVTGSTGDGFGDAFVVRGEVVSFEKTGGESEFELYLDGDDVTNELA